MFHCPYTIAKVINPSAVSLKFPAALLRIHTTFHVSRIKQFVPEPLGSAPPPGLWTVPKSTPFTHCWMFGAGAGPSSTWLTGRVTVPKKGAGFLPGASSIRSSSFRRQQQRQSLKPRGICTLGVLSGLPPQHLVEVSVSVKSPPALKAQYLDIIIQLASISSGASKM